MKTAKGTLLLAHTKRALLSLTKDEGLAEELIKDAERIAQMAGRVDEKDRWVRFSWLLNNAPVVTMSVWYKKEGQPETRWDFRPTKIGEVWSWQRVTAC